MILCMFENFEQYCLAMLVYVMSVAFEFHDFDN